MPIGYSSQLNLRQIPVLGLVAQNAAAASPPATPVKGQLWMDTTNNLLKWWDGAAWQSALGGAIADGDKGDIVVSGGGTSWLIDTGVVTLAKMAANSVDSTKIVDGSVALGDLAANSVDSSKIVDGSVALGDLATGSVDSSKIVDGSIVVGDTASSVTLDAIATAHPTAANINLNGKRITNYDPAISGILATDVVNRAYVDSVMQGLDVKVSCRMATTTNITLSNNQTIDGLGTQDGDIILVKNQTNAAQNGIYFCVAIGPWTRHPTMDSWFEVPGAYTWVESGNTLADTGWVCTSDQGGTLDTTAINWSQFAGVGTVVAGAGLTQAGNVLNAVAGDTSLIVNADELHVNTSVIASVASLAAYAPLASPALTGNPTAPTATAGDNDTSIATTAFVTTAVANAPQGTVRKYAANVGALSAGVGLDIVHSLGTTDVQVGFYAVTGGAREEFAWAAKDANTITVTSDIAYTGSTYKVVVEG